MKRLDAHKLVFIDEAGIKTSQERRYGWAQGDDKPVLMGSRYGQQVTMVGAVGYKGPRALRLQDKGMTKPDFLAFTVDDLVPTLNEGEIVVMDNLRSHYHPDAIAAIEAAGASVLFLPPYSPEFNAIEPVWGFTKGAASRVAPRDKERLKHTVRRIWQDIPGEHFAAWVHHCGYVSQSSPEART